MDTNYSAQLGLEEILKALIPYLKSLTDTAQTWDFLDDDVFPAGFLYQAGHAAEDLPDDKTDFLAFIAELPRWRGVRQTTAVVSVRFTLATGGIADTNTRAAAIALHSQRVAALMKLFAIFNRRELTSVLNDANTPWNSVDTLKLQFTGWKRAGDLQDGKSSTGNSFIATPAYDFTVNLTV